MVVVVGEAAPPHSAHRIDLGWTVSLQTALKTLTHVSSANASLPIASLFGTSTPRPWLPQLTWTFSNTHQFGKELPTNSDFAETHVPDQVSEYQSADLQWSIG